MESFKKTGIVTAAGIRAYTILLATMQEKLSLAMLLQEVERQELSAARELSGKDLLFFQGVAAIAQISAKLWAPVSEGGDGFSPVLGKAIDWGEVAFIDYCYALLGPEMSVAASVADVLMRQQQ